ncbi:MAG: hypothetical protein ACXIUB_05125 [Wenzhouxiangella sp.]
MTDQNDPIPGNYEAWKHCIEHWCEIPLTAEFVEQRLAALNNPKDEHTAKLIDAYGAGHHQQLLAWFQRWANENAQ